ncbi:MAG: hypothetical protein CMH44_14460 [Muricauda sp.]|nr:hypothetical protein [Allomuricauda sp.]
MSNFKIRFIKHIANSILRIKRFMIALVTHDIMLMNLYVDLLQKKCYTGLVFATNQVFLTNLLM